MSPFLQIIWFLKLFSLSPHYCVDLPFIDSEAIIKRVTFSAPYALVYLDVWQANGRDFTTWLKWYADTRLVEGMLTVPNAAIAGKASLNF